MIGSLEKSLPLWRCLVKPSGATQGCSPKASALGGPDGGPGLSKGHICATGPNPDEVPLPAHRLEFYAGAGLATVVTPYEGEFLPAFDEDAKRGTIKGYSAKSSRNCRKRLATITDEAIMAGLVATFTYPGTQCPDKIPTPEEFELYKDHLHRYGHCLERDWGAGMFWTQEFQERDAVHFHGIIFGVPHDRLREFQLWTSATWNRIVDGGADHLKSGTNVELPKSAGGARGYLTQYMSKKDQRRDGIECGRYWGAMNRKRIPFAECTVVELTESDAKTAKRVARKYVESKRKACSWAKLWLRTRDKMAEHFKCNMLEMSSLLEFRKLVEEADRNRWNPNWFPSLHKGGWEFPIPRVAFLGGVMLAMGGRWRLPRKPRMRNNCTVNVYCPADDFSRDLLRFISTLAKPQNEEKEEGQSSSTKGHSGNHSRSRECSFETSHDGDDSSFRDSGANRFRREREPFHGVRDVHAPLLAPCDDEDGGGGGWDQVGCGALEPDNRGACRKREARVYVLDAIPRSLGDPF